MIPNKKRKLKNNQKLFFSKKKTSKKNRIFFLENEKNNAVKRAFFLTKKPEIEKTRKIEKIEFFRAFCVYTQKILRENSLILCGSPQFFYDFLTPS